MKDTSNPRTISFVATENLFKALEQKAQKEERSISWLIRKAIEEYLAESK